ncbi:MAG: hypothetical protein V1800_15230 [Candidatus Latescibacterota bacterium]
MERVPERILKAGIQDRLDLAGRDPGGDLPGGPDRNLLLFLLAFGAGFELLFYVSAGFVALSFTFVMNLSHPPNTLQTRKE